MEERVAPCAVLLVSGSLALFLPVGGVEAQTTPIGCFSTATNFECGFDAVANNNGATAVGHTATASAFNSSAFGSQSQANGSSTVAVGYSASASVSGATAVGANSQAQAPFSLAIGAFSLAFVGADSAVAIGAQSVADEANTVSFGAGSFRRRLVNVANGTREFDAVNLGQLNAAIAASGASPYLSNSGSGPAANATFPNSLAVGAGATAAGFASTAVGQGSTANVADSTAIGRNSRALDDGSTATGADSAAIGVASTATGYISYAVGDRGTAFGFRASAGGTAGANVFNDGNTAIGAESQAGAGAAGQVNATALGRGTLANAANATALGQGANASAAGAVALGHGSVADQANTVSVGAAGRTRRIVNVAAATGDTDAVNLGQLNAAIGGIGAGATLLAQDATTGLITFGASADGETVDFTNAAAVGRRITGLAAGNVTASGTDAVTGGQLFDVQGRIDQAFSNLGTTRDALVGSLGGGAGFGGAGAFIPPSFLIQGTSYGNVADAFRRLDQQTTANTGDIAALQGAVAGGGSSLVRQSVLGGPISVGAAEGGASVGFEGSEGARRLTGVGDGAIAAGSSDAVTGSQIQATQHSIASALGGRAQVNPDGTISGQTFRVRNTDYPDVASAFGSLDTAVSGLQSQIDGLQAGGGSSPYFSASTTAGNAAATGSESLALGGGSQASGTSSTAAGSTAIASATGASAFGAEARATQVSATAIGSGTLASHANATAIGAGAATSRADQVAIGSSSSTYSMPGIGSEKSRAAQFGPVEVVTSDADGNLATMDMASFFPDVGGLENRIGAVESYAGQTRREARQGIAAAMAMTTAAMPSAPGKTSWSTNLATFKGEFAFGVSVAHRFDFDTPFAITGGYSYGGGDNHGVRVGLAGEF